jgi:hypothetical protein
MHNIKKYFVVLLAFIFTISCGESYMTSENCKQLDIRKKEIDSLFVCVTPKNLEESSVCELCMIEEKQTLAVNEIRIVLAEEYAYEIFRLSFSDSAMMCRYKSIKKLGDSFEEQKHLTYVIHVYPIDYEIGFKAKKTIDSLLEIPQEKNISVIGVPRSIFIQKHDKMLSVKIWQNKKLSESVIYSVDSLVNILKSYSKSL